VFGGLFKPCMRIGGITWQDHGRRRAVYRLARCSAVPAWKSNAIDEIQGPVDPEIAILILAVCETSIRTVYRIGV
jgi:hypothetical protein